MPVEKTPRPELKEVFADAIYDIFKHAGLPITADKLPLVRRFTDKLADSIHRQTTLDSIRLAKKAAVMTDQAFTKAQAAYDVLEAKVNELERKIEAVDREVPTDLNE